MVYLIYEDNNGRETFDNIEQVQNRLSFLVETKKDLSILEHVFVIEGKMCSIDIDMKIKVIKNKE